MNECPDSGVTDQSGNNMFVYTNIHQLIKVCLVTEQCKRIRKNMLSQTKPICIISFYNKTVILLIQM